jgi:hypothetical protein
MPQNSSTVTIPDFALCLFALPVQQAAPSEATAPQQQQQQQQHHQQQQQLQVEQPDAAGQLPMQPPTPSSATAAAAQDGAPTAPTSSAEAVGRTGSNGAAVAASSSSSSSSDKAVSPQVLQRYKELLLQTEERCRTAERQASLSGVKCVGHARTHHKPTTPQLATTPGKGLPRNAE